MSISLIIVIVIVVMVILMYNSLISKKNQVANIFASVDAVLKKRYNLIPNLVASVQEYMKHEKSILEDITKLRSEVNKPNISDEQISAARRVYNQAVTDYNNAIEMFPTNFMAPKMQLPS